MAESSVFSFVTDELEQRTSLDRLESRGTVRLALKQAGLDVASVTAEQMTVVLQKVLPGELESRGIDDAASACETLSGRLASLDFQTSSGDSPEAVFSRLGGS